jgi:serine/threonine protein phosphatase PrpC
VSSARPFVAGGAAVLNGREHPHLGGVAVKSAAATVAVGMTAGALPKFIPPTDPNEDAGAVVHGGRADLLVVADAHFGSEACELAVGHVLAALGEDPPPADVSAADLAALVYGAGIAVQQWAMDPACPNPDSASTLALALVTDDVAQWASFGDSCVVVTYGDEGRRLDTPARAYLGQGFEIEEIDKLLTHGRYERRPGDCVVVGTDGLVDAIEPAWSTMASLVSAYVERSYGAAAIVESLIDLALQRESADAVTVAVAIGYARGS